MNSELGCCRRVSPLQVGAGVETHKEMLWKSTGAELNQAFTLLLGTIWPSGWNRRTSARLMGSRTARVL